MAEAAAGADVIRFLVFKASEIVTTRAGSGLCASDRRGIPAATFCAARIGVTDLNRGRGPQQGRHF